MAIWQFRLILLPEEMLLQKYSILPPTIPRELAEDFAWWSSIQPPMGFERQIDLILPQMDSWSTEMRMRGHTESNDAHVIYVDENKEIVEENNFSYRRQCNFGRPSSANLCFGRTATVRPNDV